MSTRIHIGQHDDFPDNTIRRVEGDEHDIAVCRLHGDLFAFVDECPHMKWPLSNGHLEGGLLYCSLHLAKFDPQTGACLGPPASESLETFEVVDEDGMLYVCLDGDTDVDASTTLADTDRPQSA